MAGTTVKAALSDDSRLVRKHGTQILAIADYSTPLPDTLFAAADADGVVLPNPLPEGYFNMGFITTDGIVISSDVSQSTVNMVQTTATVRSDIDSIADSLAVTFGESSGWTKALAYGLPCSEWPDDKTKAYDFNTGTGDFPYYRGLILTQDGVGKDAFYRVEVATRMQVSDIGDRTLNRTDAEGVDRTFACLEDPVLGYSRREASTGVYAAPAGGGA